MPQIEFALTELTHSLNNDKMELISLLVPDDQGKGFPCSFFISNRIDTETISLFYSCLKLKIGRNIETNIFLPVLENIFYSSWTNIMGTPHWSKQSESDSNSIIFFYLVGFSVRGM